MSVVVGVARGVVLLACRVALDGGAGLEGSLLGGAASVPTSIWESSVSIDCGSIILLLFLASKLLPALLEILVRTSSGLIRSLIQMHLIRWICSDSSKSLKKNLINDRANFFNQILLGFYKEADQNLVLYSCNRCLHYIAIPLSYTVRVILQTV